MDTSESDKIRRVDGSNEKLSSLSGDSFDDTRPRRFSLESVDTLNESPIISGGIKQCFGLSPDKQSIVRTKSFTLWTDQSRFNDSVIEIFCNLTTTVH